jgi:CTP:molybdopterin cytidylyltransferase MocA
VGIPAILMAGDRGAAKAIHGESKVYLEIAGRPMVSRVVATLQHVPEVSEVWVVGDSKRLEAVLSASDLRSEIQKPLHIVEQFENIYQNAWETYKRSLPGAPPEGRQPQGEDHDFQVLYLSGDLPFAHPEELSDFIRQGQALDCDYALGLVRKAALEPFTKSLDGTPGLDLAYFNLRDGRLRQNNLHLARPSRIGNRHLAGNLYRHRHMREFGNMAALISGLFFSRGGAAILFIYLIMHVGGYFDRKGWTWLADAVRQLVTLRNNEWGISRLMACDFRFVVSDIGGCAIDVDTEDEYELVNARFEEWSQASHGQIEAELGRTLADAAGEPPRPGGTSRDE